eukprot:600746-Amphidinium_carterae.1
MLLKDPRLLQQVDTLRDTMLEEMGVLQRLPVSVRKFLGGILSESGSKFQDGVLFGSQVMCAYVLRKIFLEVQQLPW